MSRPSSKRPSGTATTDRYARQVLFEKIGHEGQRRLGDAHVLLVGCGALGTVIASTLVRAGVGHLRICDRDFIERNNLQRQILFDEDDIAANLPKAQAAAAKLRRINPDVTVEPLVADATPSNIGSLADGVSIILDGTDNFETRFLINDLAVSTNRPWVYGAVIGATGLCMTIVPHETPCLRCIFEEAPPPEMNPTCDTAGVLGPAVNIIASLQAMEAIKLLVGRVDEINRHLLHLDAWSGRLASMKVERAAGSTACPCCQRHEFPYLTGATTSKATTLCGRDAVQVSPSSGGSVSFETIAEKLSRVAAGPITRNAFLLKVSIDGYGLTIFADGRAIIQGTEDTEKARSLYARYVGA